MEMEQLIAEVKKDGLDSVEMFAMKLAEKAPLALEIAAKKTSTPIDDVVIAALKEPLKQVLLDMAGKISK